MVSLLVLVVHLAPTSGGRDLPLNDYQHGDLIKPKAGQWGVKFKEIPPNLCLQERQP